MQNTKAYAMLVCATLFWAGNFIIGKLAFISNNTGSQQIHVRWIDDGETAVVSQLQESPSNLSWSPDGKWLAFTMNVKAVPETIAEPRAKPEGANWAEKPITVTTTQYQYDGQGIVEPAYRHVFIIPADGGSARQLTQGNFNHYGSLARSLNSDHIFFSAYHNYILSIKIVPVGT